MTGNLGQRHHKKSSDLLQHFVCPSQNSFLPKMCPVQSFYQYRKRIKKKETAGCESFIYTKLPQYYFRDHFQGGSVPNNTLNSLFTSLGKVCVLGGVLCVGECTAHICQDHSQTPTLSLAARERERPMITSMCFQQTHVVLTLAKTTGAPFYTVLGWKTCTHAI